MEHPKKHILLCGNHRTGRSSMLRALTQELHVPLYGYMTRTLNTRADGYHEIYMFPTAPGSLPRRRSATSETAIPASA